MSNRILIRDAQPKISVHALVRFRAINNSLGTFIIAQRHDEQLRSFWLDDDDAHALDDVREDRRWKSDTIRSLRDYFAGRPFDFDDIPTPDGPEFFQRCWDACRRITPGQPISYGQLATDAGSPQASRAAGQAMRRNPLPIIVPCHRVVSSTGSLHGFAGKTDPDSAALQRKKRLLELEQG